jgi:hypothetical protein
VGAEVELLVELTELDTNFGFSSVSVKIGAPSVDSSSPEIATSAKAFAMSAISFT